MAEHHQDQDGIHKQLRVITHTFEYTPIDVQVGELVTSDDHHVQGTTGEVDLSSHCVRKLYPLRASVEVRTNSPQNTRLTEIGGAGPLVVPARVWFAIRQERCMRR